MAQRRSRRRRAALAAPRCRRAVYGLMTNSNLVDCTTGRWRASSTLFTLPIGRGNCAGLPIAKVPRGGPKIQGPRFPRRAGPRNFPNSLFLVVKTGISARLHSPRDRGGWVGIGGGWSWLARGQAWVSGGRTNTLVGCRQGKKGGSEAEPRLAATAPAASTTKLDLLGQNSKSET